MGLDMYLDRAKRINNATIEEILSISSYIDWEQNIKGEYTYEEWCGKKEEDIDKELASLYKKEYKMKHMDYDSRNIKHESIIENVIYWRKANQIHNWFVENIQNEIDDCGYYEVNKQQLELLLKICIIVKENSKLIKGKIKNGYTFDSDGNRIPIFQDGMYIEDPFIAEKLLPTCEGFFFGSNDYNEYYMDDINYTIEKIQELLRTTDFDKEIVFYNSSW